MATKDLANAELKERQFRKRILFGAALIAFLSVVAMSGVVEPVVGFLFDRRSHQAQYEDDIEDTLFLRRKKSSSRVRLRHRKLRGVRGVSRRQRNRRL
jgi:hypothetical protein